jgi:hypothetical protein
LLSSIKYLKVIVRKTSYQSIGAVVHSCANSKTFFQQNNLGYPGKWNSHDLWKGLGKYKDLRLFDLDGNFIMDPEGLKSKGLLYEEFEGFKV